MLTDFRKINAVMEPMRVLQPGLPSPADSKVMENYYH